jgi:hypothetical protein
MLLLPQRFFFDYFRVKEPKQNTSISSIQAIREPRSRRKKKAIQNAFLLLET